MKLRRTKTQQHPHQSKDEKKQKQQKKPKTSPLKTITTTYKSISYQIVGKHIPFKQETVERYNQKLHKADMNFITEVYFSVIVLSTIIITIISFILFNILFTNFISPSSSALYIIGLTILTSFVTAGFLPFVMMSKISNRKRQIDQELPFLLSELSILASTGLTPIKIFRHIAQKKEDIVLNKEIRKIIFKADIEGKDLISALGEVSKETPSDNFREVLWDTANMIHQGGDLDIYLRSKADLSLQLKRDIQKEFIEKIATFSEVYAALVLVGVLFIGIAAFLMDAMNSSFGGLNSTSLFLLLTYGIIPVAVVVIIVMVSMTYSKSG